MAQGVGLHIGLNSVDPGHYDGWSGPLVACEADAKAFRAIAESQHFSTQMLLTAAATREAVLAAIGGAAERLVEGDFFLLTYSGHGGQLPDRDGEEADRLDETWCLYDAQLVDDEIYLALGRFKSGVRVLMLSDSCHSGTVAKMIAMRAETVETGPAVRAMPSEIALRTYESHRAFYDAILSSLPNSRGLELGEAVAASVRLISGCQDNQFSYDGPFNGEFTGALLSVWAGGRFKGDYDDFHRRIVAQLPSRQSPNHMTVGMRDLAYDRQTPFTL